MKRYVLKTERFDGAPQLREVSAADIEGAFSQAQEAAREIAEENAAVYVLDGAGVLRATAVTAARSRVLRECWQERNADPPPD